jgi:broad specificity phosphatase PhoE
LPQLTAKQTSPLTHLQLLRHAPTEATRQGRFAADEELDPPGRAAAAAIAAGILTPPADLVLASPARRCRQTAELAGLIPAIDPALAECDFGAWEGRSFAEVAAQAHTLTDAWLRDPDAAPHGGESLRRFSARVSEWLDQLTGATGSERRVLAITHAGVIRAAVTHALGAPLASFWKLSVAPLSVTELLHADGGWSLRCFSAAVGPPPTLAAAA